MKKIAAIAILVLVLTVAAGATNPDKGALRTCMGFATTSTGITTHNGSDIQRAQVIYTPSTFAGFTCPMYVYVRGKDESEARTVAAQIMGFGIRNLIARVWTGTSCMKPGDLLVDLTKKSLNGREGERNSSSSSQGSSYGYSRHGGYHTSTSSSGSTSSGMDAAVVYLRYGFSLEMMAPDHQMDIVPAPNIPIGGSDSAVTNQHASDSYSSNRSYGNSRGSSNYHHSSSSSSSSYRSPEIEKEMMRDRIADRANSNIAALIVDAITNAAVSGQIPNAILRTQAQVVSTTTSVSVQEQNVAAPLQ